MDKKYRVPKTAITEKGLKKLLREAIKDYPSSSDWAKSHGVTPQAVSSFLRKVQGPGLRIPELLGYRPQLVFLPVDEPLIATMYPPRRATDKPTRKVDHTKDPIEKGGRKVADDRERVKERLKKRNR